MKFYFSYSIPKIFFGNCGLNIYLSHKGSAGAVPRLQKIFDDSGFHFFALDHATPNAAEIHNSTLENCDGFAVLYDPATLDWAEKTTHQALITSWRSERPRALATFEVPPPARPFANSADTLVQIRWNPEIAEKDIAPFLNVLEESNA